MFTHETKNLVGYIDGGLPPEAHDRVERHLEVCHLCRTELAEMRAARRALQAAGHHAPAPTYDSELWSRVHAQIARPRPTPRLQPRWALATGAFALAATAAILVMTQDGLQTGSPDGMLATRPTGVVTKGKPSDKPAMPGEAWNATASGAQGVSPALGKARQAIGAPAAPPAEPRSEKRLMAAVPPSKQPMVYENYGTQPVIRPDSAVRPNAPAPPPTAYYSDARRDEKRPTVNAPTRAVRSRSSAASSDKYDMDAGDINGHAAPSGAPVSAATPSADAPRGRAGGLAAGAPMERTLLAELATAPPPPVLTAEPAAPGPVTAFGVVRPDQEGVSTRDRILNGSLDADSLSGGPATTSLGTTVMARGATPEETLVAPEVVAGPPPDYAKRMLGIEALARETTPDYKLEWNAQPAPKSKQAASEPSALTKVTGGVATRPPTETGRRLYAQADTDFQSGRMQEAITNFQKALDAGISLGDQRKAHMRLGDAAVKERDDETALKEYTAALLITRDAEVLSKLGGVYERLGNVEKARTAYQQALIFNQGQLDARAGLARLKSRKR